MHQPYLLSKDEPSPRSRKAAAGWRYLATRVWVLLGFLLVKITMKFAGVLPVALRYVRPHAGFTTLLMSTGLTFGTISSLYGLNAGILDRGQFTVLIGAVIGSAIIPTIVAQRWFAPPLHDLTAEEIAGLEDEEFEPGRRNFTRR